MRSSLALTLLAVGASGFVQKPAWRPLGWGPLATARMSSNGEPETGTAVKMSTIDRESIIYDSRTGRFYEKEIEMICREEFCAIDEKSGKPIVLSLEEKETIFIDAMKAYFFDGREVLNDRDFDQLKEDLMWEGSVVAALSRDENKYLAAMQAYLAGNPILSDGDFNALKKQLLEQRSPIAVSSKPTCLVDSGICSITWSQDKVRQYVAYLPTAAVVTALWAIFTFELTPLRYVNPLFAIVLGAYPIFYASIFLAENVFFKNPLVASGPCPECNAENRVLFGDVLGVEGFADEAKLKCSNCKVELTVGRKSLRVSSPPKFDLPEAKAATA